MNWYIPDFDTECRVCGRTPCVVVARHKQGDTELCGPHFFQDAQMVVWELWNEQDDPKLEESIQ